MNNSIGVFILQESISVGKRDSPASSTRCDRRKNCFHKEVVHPPPSIIHDATATGLYSMSGSWSFWRKVRDSNPRTGFHRSSAFQAAPMDQAMGTFRSMASIALLTTHHRTSQLGAFKCGGISLFRVVRLLYHRDLLAIILIYTTFNAVPHSTQNFAVALLVLPQEEHRCLCFTVTGVVIRLRFISCWTSASRRCASSRDTSGPRST